MALESVRLVMLIEQNHWKNKDNSKKKKKDCSWLQAMQIPDLPFLWWSSGVSVLNQLHGTFQENKSYFLF